MVVGEFTEETDFVVIGGGPGGYSAAFRAADLGIETTIVDSQPCLGGCWLHTGCIPSKALLYLANAIHGAEHAAHFGVHFDKPKVDLDRVRSWMSDTIGCLAADLEAQCTEHGVRHITGKAAFEGSRQIRIHNGGIHRLHFKHALIATGSQDTPHPAAINSERVLYPGQAFQLEKIPDTLLVLGDRSISLELATLFAALGSEVTIAVPGPRLLPRADRELVAELVGHIGGTFEGVHLDVQVTSMRETADGVSIEYSGDDPPRRSTFDQVLCVLGKAPRIDGIGLEQTSVRLDDGGYIVVDKQMRTTDGRIFAVGDVVGHPMLSHKAIHQGQVAAEVAAGWGSDYDPRAVPMVMFTNPQLAWCGLTESELIEAEHPYEVQRMHWALTGRADTQSRLRGLTKLIFDPDTQLLLGMSIVGPNAADMISEGVLAIEMGAVMEDLAATMHPHAIRGEFIGRSTTPPAES